MGEVDDNSGNGQVAAEALEAFKPFEHFCRCLLDAYAVVDASGKVLKCNAMFTQIAGLKTKQVLKAGSFDEVLRLAVAGRDLPVAELLQNPGPTRLDEVAAEALGQQDVKLRNLFLIIGLYPLSRDGKPVGAFILLRDVTAEASLQGKYKDKATASITDPLTGLFNRGYFADYLKSQVQTLESFPHAAPQRIMSVVIMDLDFFKKINDGYGHQAGDYVLVHTAELMKNCFRKTDVVARYGGEEFLCILPGTDLAGAAVAADKLRQMVAGFHFEHDGKVIPVTISSGVAQITIGHETGEQAVARADAALYFSKEKGRNRVSIHDGLGPKPADAKIQDAKVVGPAA